MVSGELSLASRQYFHPKERGSQKDRDEQYSQHRK